MRTILTVRFATGETKVYETASVETAKEFERVLMAITDVTESSICEKGE